MGWGGRNKRHPTPTPRCMCMLRLCILIAFSFLKLWASKQPPLVLPHCSLRFRSPHDQLNATSLYLEAFVQSVVLCWHGVCRTVCAVPLIPSLLVSLKSRESTQQSDLDPS